VLAGVPGCMCAWVVGRRAATERVLDLSQAGVALKRVPRC